MFVNCLLHKYDDIYTPIEALYYIVPFLPKDKIYWECCYGKGYLAQWLRKYNYTVIGSESIDFINQQPEEEYDIIITNPPFSKNKIFFKRAIELNKPFAFLCRLEHLGGVKAYELFKNIHIQIIIPKRRIHYITPKMLRNEKVHGSLFHSIWLTYKLDLPKDIIYYDYK